MQNGKNGHPNGKTHFIEDKGDHEARPKPCCERLDNGGWCSRIVGHDGPHDAMPRRHGPEVSIWHQHRGQKKICGKVVSPSTMCLFQRGHSGDCK